MNVLTEWLDERFQEVSSREFYRELFPEGTLAVSPSEKSKRNGVIIRAWKDEDGTERAERHLLHDDLSAVDFVLAVDTGFEGVKDLCSPVSYAGRRPMLDKSHELFALVFDLDGVKIEDDVPIGMTDLFFQMQTLEDRPALLPTPTYVASSGTGLHLYYMLEEPIRLWPNVCEQLRLFRDSLTKRLWNKYVSDLSQEVQLESVVQSFRMVGSLSKSGDQIVRAFKTGDRVSMDYMNGFVPEELRLTREVLESKHTLAEARMLWPEWDPEWRRKAAQAPDTPWKVKRALFDWWCRRVEGLEPFEGNRYWCLFVAACYAAKCPEVTYEELEAWAYRIRPVLDQLTTMPGNEFTVDDVQAALAAYGNPVSVNLRRDKVFEKTQMVMPVNKRNGRKQEVHMATMRAVQNVIDPKGNWRNKNGRPVGSGTKADQVRAYVAEHPEANNSQIAKALGVSRTTVVKWIKPGVEEMEREKRQAKTKDAFAEFLSKADERGVMTPTEKDYAPINGYLDEFNDLYWEMVAAGNRARQGKL